MSTIRQVAKGSTPPVGGSVSSDAGDLPTFSAIDHVHSFWSKWYEVPLLKGFEGFIYFSLCGNMVWLRESVDLIPESTTSTLTAVLPKVARPNRTIRYESIKILSNGEVYYLNSSGDNENLYNGVIANNNDNDLFIDDLIYRTIMPL